MKKEIRASLDLTLSGHVLNRRIRKQGYTISAIQKELDLLCPQSVYRWIRGEAMPSVDNLYNLSRILEVHMEDLVVPRNDAAWYLWERTKADDRPRLWAYHRRYQERRRAAG
ncbi:MAG: helix-turn-helix domain-containing protein [Lachnospiraceae bacterium]|nr:helix-turn-helix domain-containing protein [Lachnospiraceae bacterium]MDE6983077.1 helix-turn-helix domain-containing protein [Lachnospiraceae bacterium]MDE7030814.1 helix-turn-helix domain-containing protein [Lachnospiraceae bacterium]